MLSIRLSTEFIYQLNGQADCRLFAEAFGRTSLIYCNGLNTMYLTKKYLNKTKEAVSKVTTK